MFELVYNLCDFLENERVVRVLVGLGGVVVWYDVGGVVVRVDFEVDVIAKFPKVFLEFGPVIDRLMLLVLLLLMQDLKAVAIAKRDILKLESPIHPVKRVVMVVS